MTEPAEHDAVNESVPPEVDIQVDPENSGLATARLLMKRVPTVLVSSVLLALITAGAILSLSPNYRDTARNLGLGIVMSSLLVFSFGIVLLIIGRELTITTIGEVRIDPKLLFDGVLAVAEGMGIRMLTYSGVLLLVGLVLLMISRSKQTGDKSYSDEQESRVTVE